MEEIKRIFNKKILIALLPLTAGFVTCFILIIAVVAFAAGKEMAYQQSNNMRVKGVVINNQLYAGRYKELLNKYLTTKGYVSLERLVFYLQRTHNVLDTSTLSVEDWDKAYLENINVEEKQMVPIKTICKKLDSDISIPTLTIESGTNEAGLQIDVINLCLVNDVDVTNSDEYDEEYYPLPFSFPLRTNFTVTSMVFENRDVDLGLSAEEQENVNFHNGWDLGVSVGTNFYSMCDGKVSNVTNSQNNDLTFEYSGNKTGNGVKVECNNGLTLIYWHTQFMSQPVGVRTGALVKKGDLLGRTSTTGQSTGPHLHLGMQDSNGEYLDAMAYIDFTEYEGS